MARVLCKRQMPGPAPTRKLAISCLTFGLSTIRPERSQCKRVRPTRIKIIAQSSLSQTACLILIDVFLIGLIEFDRRRRLAARPYIVTLLSYLIIEACWVSLGRPI